MKEELLTLMDVYRDPHFFKDHMKVEYAEMAALFTIHRNWKFSR